LLFFENFEFLTSFIETDLGKLYAEPANVMMYLFLLLW